MHQYLYKYLVLHQQLSIPELGHFTVETAPAVFNQAGTAILPPIPVTHFKAGAVLADKHFYDFLAIEMGTDEIRAIQAFREFSNDLRNGLATQESVTLNGIGILRKEMDQTVFFTPEKEPFPAFLPTIRLPHDVVLHTAQPDTDDDATSAGDAIEIMESTSQVTDTRWRLYALILFITGIAAIVLYYL